MKNLFVALLLLCTTGSLRAQTPTLIENLLAGSAPSNPQGLINFNGKIYFAAFDSTHGIELREKVANNPTTLVSDFLPGYNAGVSLYGIQPMCVYNGRLYYDGLDNVSTHRLMEFDGVNPPSKVSNPLPGTNLRSLLVLNNKLYFSADSSIQLGCIHEYTITGGTKRLYPVGQLLRYASAEPVMIAYKGKLYFAKDSASRQQELHCYDPATGAANRVADIWTGVGGSWPGMFVVAGSKLYFSADDSVHGRELYSYNGANVVRETDVVPGTGGSMEVSPHYTKSMKVHKGAIYIEGVTSKPDYVVYKFDTATKAVTVVYNFGSLYPDIQAWHSTNNNLYFCARTAAAGRELWHYDGKVCTMVADLNPGAGDGVGSSTMASYEGDLVFNGDNGATGKELYRVTDVATNGIQNINWSGKVNVYPNPASTTVHFNIDLQSRESISISLTNAAGQEVHSTGAQQFESGAKTVTIPLQSFVPGQYFYRLSSQSGQLLASGAIVRQ